MNDAIFKNEAYWRGDTQLLRTTQLLAKHGLTKDLSNIPPEILSAKAARGTQIHKEIENYIRTGEIGFASKELLDFIDFSEELGLFDLRPEAIVNNDIVGGTIDLMAKRLANGKTLKVIIDYKTGVEVYIKGVRWQLTSYEYLSEEDFDELWVFHLGEESKKYTVERITREEVDKLFAAERAGEIYQEPGLIIAFDLLERAQEAELILKQAEAAKETAKATAEEYRELLYRLMGEQGIKSWETLDKSMLITRVEPTTKTGIDGVKLKKDLPDIAAKYSKTSEVKGYVKITIREG